jgi:hypothetical protein
LFARSLAVIAPGRNVQPVVAIAKTTDSAPVEAHHVSSSPQEDRSGTVGEAEGRKEGCLVNVPMTGQEFAAKNKANMSAASHYLCRCVNLKSSERAVPHYLSGRGKLLHQICELCGVFLLNDGLSEILPCFTRVWVIASCFFQDHRGISGQLDWTL